MLHSVGILFFAGLAGAGGSFYSTDAHTPPFLRRTGTGAEIVQWDTGDLARDVALSHGVIVSYQGVYTLHTGLHVSIPSQHRAHGFACDEYKDALCLGKNQTSLVLPASGTIVVAAEPSPPLLPERLLAVKNVSCGFSAMGYGRVVTDSQRYDLSACDVYSMTFTFFFYDETLYVIPMTHSPAVHFLLCVAAMFTLSGLLYIMQPQNEVYATGNTPVRSNNPLDVAMTVTVLAACTNVSAHFVNNSFLTNEDIAGFVTSALTFMFYALSACVTRLAEGTGLYEPGVTADAFIAGVALSCISVYATLQHPFNFVITALLLFRMWNKLMRFSYGGAYAPKGEMQIPYVVARFVLDSVGICFAIVYGWVPSFDSHGSAGLALVSTLLGAYLAAKYAFLLHTNMDAPAAEKVQ